METFSICTPTTVSISKARSEPIGTRELPGAFPSGSGFGGGDVARIGNGLPAACGGELGLSFQSQALDLPGKTIRDVCIPQRGVVNVIR